MRRDQEVVGSRPEDLSAREFERLCLLYYKAHSYKLKETGEAADGGVDLVIYNSKDGGHEAVQIKHYIHSENSITVEKIRELNSAKKNHKCAFSKFITTSRFTRDALREADTYQMDCHDLNWVKNHIVKWQEEGGGRVG